MTPKDFDAMVAPFLETQDHSKNQETYCTELETAEGVLQDLRNHLFAEEIAKEERRLKYLELKAEFDPEPKPKRVVKYMADCLPETEPLE